MNGPQIFAACLLMGALVLFAWGRWRHDVVALLVLLVAVAGGLVAPSEAFAGFGHAAVVTVAAVLVLSHALESTGVIGALAQRLAIDQPSLGRQVAIFCCLGAVLSAFVNNVGALAMLMPLAVATARKHDLPPSGILMPLSFATMLGGMTTLIGTPPNIIVSAYRAETVGRPFALFDFAPIGVAVAVAGVSFLAVVGWRLIPRGRQAVQAFAELDEYIAELHLGDESSLAGRAVEDVGGELESRDVQLLGLLRDGAWTPGVSPWEKLKAGDVLLVEAAPKVLAGLQGWNDVSLGSPEHTDETLRPADIALAEVVLRPQSPPIGSTAEELRMRTRYRVNLIGVSRQGARYFGALKTFRFAAGDVLLLQGAPTELNDAISTFEALPLGDRNVIVHAPREAYIATFTFVAALAAIASGLVPAMIAMTAAVVVLLLFGVVRAGRAYAAIDGSVIVVLGALIPVGQSLQATGLTEVIGQGVLTMTQGMPVYICLGLILAITMFLSDVINNAATAVVMAPVASSVATGLGANPEAFLMAVAIGASCAFLTPIGHQNNLLVMGPGGYRFGDFWRLGLPLELLIIVIATLLLPMAWPLGVRAVEAVPIW